MFVCGEISAPCQGVFGFQIIPGLCSNTPALGVYLSVTIFQGVNVLVFCFSEETCVRGRSYKEKHFIICLLVVSELSHGGEHGGTWAGMMLEK